LVKRGAQHIVLIGRSGAGGAGVEQAIGELRDQGATIREEALDASDEASLAALFSRLSVEAPPVRGVFHAAMVLDDALIENLTLTRIEPVWRAKIKTAVALDRLTRKLDLDCFVLFSSAATMIGNPGQASYVAANAFLEGLAQKRRAAGLPAVAIAWGAISDAGYLARTSQGNELLNRRLGKHSLKVEEALDALEQILQGNETDPAQAVIGFSRFDWGAISRQLPSASTPLLEFMRQEQPADVEREGGGGTLAEELGSLQPEKARARVADILCAEIGRILRIAATHIDRDKPLSDIGLDSLMGVELRLSAEERLGIEVPLMSIGGAGSLNDLSGRIVKLLREKGPGGATPALENLIHIHSSVSDVETEEIATIAAEIEKRESTVKRVF
jgi:acyl carrier protein